MIVAKVTLLVFVWLPWMPKGHILAERDIPTIAKCEIIGEDVLDHWRKPVNIAGGKLRFACEASV